MLQNKQRENRLYEETVIHVDPGSVEAAVKTRIHFTEVSLKHHTDVFLMMGEGEGCYSVELGNRTLSYYFDTANRFTRRRTN